MAGFEISETPEYKATMARLEAVKRTTPKGIDYWVAREINDILGYPTWREFENVISRAKAACEGTGIDPAKHFVPTHTMVELGSGAKRSVEDYFLSRPACSLIAMNGDPIKPEIAAAQVYYTVQTRRMELHDQLSEDEKRVELRNKVAQSHKRVSGAANKAGVRNTMQGVFHDARYQGLYGMPLKDVRLKKGLGENEQLYDRAGPLELSANDFQMNLAADVLTREQIQGEQRAIQKNREVAVRVRKAMQDSGTATPENLPLAPPIKEIKKKIEGRKKLPGPSSD
jgi:DNA-damage-inducible protein D